MSSRSSTSCSHGTEQCFGCNRSTKRYAVCQQCRHGKYFLCEACAHRSEVLCVECNSNLRAEDVRTDSDLRSADDAASIGSSGSRDSANAQSMAARLQSLEQRLATMAVDVRTDSDLRSDDGTAGIGSCGSFGSANAQNMAARLHLVEQRLATVELESYRGNPSVPAALPSASHPRPLNSAANALAAPCPPHLQSEGPPAFVSANTLQRARRHLSEQELFLSKQLVLILRYDALDNRHLCNRDGWMEVATLITELQLGGRGGRVPTCATQAEIHSIVRRSFTKGLPRFEISVQDGRVEMIRAVNVEKYRGRRQSRQIAKRSAVGALHGQARGGPAGHSDRVQGLDASRVCEAADASLESIGNIDELAEPEEWTKYLTLDHPPRVWFCRNGSEEHFFQDAPGPWSRFQENGAVWRWCHSETDRWFYEAVSRPAVSTQAATHTDPQATPDDRNVDLSALD